MRETTKIHSDTAPKAMFFVTVAVGIMGGLAFAIAFGDTGIYKFLGRSALGFWIAWGLAYLAIKG